MTRYEQAMELLRDKEHLDEHVFEYNYIFTLGYDLLQNFLSEKPCECDAAFEFCKIIYTRFQQSEYDNPNRPEYDCLKEYVDSLTYDQLDKLYWTDWSTL